MISWNGRYLCDSGSNFGDNEASVACREMGYDSFETNFKSSCPGATQGYQFAGNQFRCQGNESKLEYCLFTTVTSSCLTSIDCIGLICKADSKLPTYAIVLIIIGSLALVMVVLFICLRKKI